MSVTPVLNRTRLLEECNGVFKTGNRMSTWMSHADAWAHARMVEEVIRAVSTPLGGNELLVS